MPKKLSLDVIRACLLIRFHTEFPNRSSPTFLSYASIERATGVHANRVKHLCWKAVNSSRIEKDAKKR